TSMWAKKGWSLPDGLLAHSLSEVQKEYMNKGLDRSREIAIKQADLEHPIEKVGKELRAKMVWLQSQAA
ncbi:MAG: hypothetical protein KKH61_10290, partial [Gammaproteobacteria bacterium]|nr:hypothetical protein [Gammaproteobacteria bacterium]